MKNLAKLIVVTVFGLGGLFTFLSSVDVAGIGTSVIAQVKPTPTPANTAANAVKPVTTPANTAPSAPPTAPSTPPPSTGGKTMTKTFELNKEGGDGIVPFDHDNHAFKNYSPDGKTQITCVECHHTDQPKSALKPPLVTSEREVTLTLDTWKTSTQKVSECKSCHFLSTDIPDGKEMPKINKTERGKTVSKDLNNEYAYHVNCNDCHDAAYKARPDLKKKAGFATSAATDCKICHSK